MKRQNHFKLLTVSLIMILLNFSVVLSQNSEKTKYRTLIKETLNGYYLDDSEKSFNAYTEYDDLNLDLDYNLDLTMPEIREINEPQVLVEKSKEMAYNIISDISKSVLMNQIKEGSEYQNIILNFKYKTKDYKYIRQKLAINVQSLYSISENMNRGGFYKILKDQ